MENLLEMEDIDLSKDIAYMFLWFKKKKIAKMKTDVQLYIDCTYIPTISTKHKKDSNVCYSMECTCESFPHEIPEKERLQKSKPKTFEEKAHSGIRYSVKVDSSDFFSKDKYDEKSVSKALGLRKNGIDTKSLLGIISNSKSQSFVECMLSYVQQKDLKSSDVYRAAQIDRRLYSKIISDIHYSPGKDTAVAIGFALKLSLDEATDLLNRAGYSLSHSTKRDIIIEYFFKERVYNISEINTVLYELGEKPLGR